MKIGNPKLLNFQSALEIGGEGVGEGGGMWGRISGERRGSRRVVGGKWIEGEGGGGGKGKKKGDEKEGVWGEGGKVGRK